MEVFDSYNFGLVLLQCKKFKDNVISKIELLVKKFRAHLVADFDDILMEKWLTNEHIREKVEKDWGDDIERNIEQTHFIESLHCDEVFEKLIESIEMVKEKKVFLDKLYIAITPD